MELIFELERKSIPVTLAGKPYVLREMTGFLKGKYNAQMGAKMNIEEGKIKGITNFEGLQTSLLALCLYDASDVLVPIEVIQEYPDSVVSALYVEAQKLNGIGAGSDVELKND